MSSDFNNTHDIIDIRNVIARAEEIEAEIAEALGIEETELSDESITQVRAIDIALANEAEEIRDLLEELRGNGGDEQWRGDWYPVTLIRDSYFEDHARDLADDIGAINANATWPNNCIDWECAARELQIDYTAVEYDGVTYWFR